MIFFLFPLYSTEKIVYNLFIFRGNNRIEIKRKNKQKQQPHNSDYAQRKVKRKMKIKRIDELQIGDVVTSASPYWSYDWVVVASPVEGYVATVPEGHPEIGIYLLFVNDSSVLVKE